MGKLKGDANGNVERYKACLVVKGYAQESGIDFNNFFSLVVCRSTIHVMPIMAIVLDLELKQLNDRIIFFCENLDEEVYMTQLEDFIVENKKNLVCLLTNHFIV